MPDRPGKERFALVLQAEPWTTPAVSRLRRARFATGRPSKKKPPIG
jgi:hypothetical protein